MIVDVYHDYWRSKFTYACFGQTYIPTIYSYWHFPGCQSSESWALNSLLKWKIEGSALYWCIQYRWQIVFSFGRWSSDYWPPWRFTATTNLQLQSFPSSWGPSSVAKRIPKRLWPSAASVFLFFSLPLKLFGVFQVFHDELLVISCTDYGDCRLTSTRSRG